MGFAWLSEQTTIWNCPFSWIQRLVVRIWTNVSSPSSGSKISRVDPEDRGEMSFWNVGSHTEHTALRLWTRQSIIHVTSAVRMPHPANDICNADAAYELGSKGRISRTVAQEISDQLPTAAVRVRVRVMSDLWWTKRQWGRFPPSTSVSLVNDSFNPPLQSHHHLSTRAATICQ
jgi:hypothetical protein